MQGPPPHLNNGTSPEQWNIFYMIPKEKGCFCVGRQLIIHLNYTIKSYSHGIIASSLNPEPCPKDYEMNPFKVQS